MTDETLVARVRTADPAAFDELCLRHYAFVVAQCRRVTRDAYAAEDLAQDVFTKLWRSPPQSCGISLRPLLYRMSVNAGVSFLRRRRDVTLETLDAEIGGGDIESAVIADLEGAAVRRSLADLLPAQREALYTHYFGCLSHAQAARELGLPLGTLKTRIRAGLSSLRDVWLQRSA